MRIFSRLSLLFSGLALLGMLGCGGSSTSATTTSATRYLDVVFSGIETTADIGYGSNTTLAGSTKDLKLDFYAPAADTELKRPLLILLPGGGFTAMTDKGQLGTYASELTKYGYVVACINYRTFDGSGTITNTILKTLLVQGMQDARAAVRFFRQDAATNNLYKIDPARIFLGGHSAGGMVSGHAVYLDDPSKADSEFQTIIAANGGLEGTSGSSGYDSSVSGWIDLAGSLLDKAYLTAASKPMLGIYGTSDTLMPYGDGTFELNPPGAPMPLVSAIPVSGSLSLYNQAIAVGVTKSAIYAIEGGDHFAPADSSQTKALSSIAQFMYSLR